MHPQCETVGRYVLPILRSLVAKELIEKYNFTQMEAAQRLGTTQAAISQYIHSKRGYRRLMKLQKTLPKIEAAASDTAKLIVSQKMDKDAVMNYFCNVCKALHEE